MQGKKYLVLLIAVLIGIIAGCLYYYFAAKPGVEKPDKPEVTNPPEGQTTVEPTEKPAPEKKEDGGEEPPEPEVEQTETEKAAAGMQHGIFDMLTGAKVSMQNDVTGLAPQSFMAMEEDAYMQIMPDPGPNQIQMPEFNTEEYRDMEENPFLSVKASPLSTFAADVDTASYANFRRQILKDGKAVKGSVRIEEMVNYFRYDYPEPKEGEPFSVTTEIAPNPWNEQTKLLLVGLKAKDVDKEKMPQSNLVFLIDVSGSMDEPNKLPLVQRAFKTLVESMNEDDKVSIVTYSSGEKVVLDGVPVREKAKIMDAIEELYASGATNGADALNMAYKLAEKNFIKDGNNRIIMATDGDFNVGITSESELADLVKEKAQNGVSISVLGFGMGNYKDTKLETISKNGKGNYAYIDSIDEARKVLVEEAGGTLFTVAKDVKIQVDFNPEKIKGYRLIGYENRVMAAEDFVNDKKDGGAIGAGHQVTALYEIVPVDSEFEIPDVQSKYAKPDEKGSEAKEGEEYLTVNIRYKEPDEDTSKLLEYPVTEESVREEMSENMNWAAGVAQIGMLVKESKFAGTSDMKEVRERLKTITGGDDYREEFVYIIRKIAD